jgi:hypothetical protein
MTSYDEVGVKEDVSDVITNIVPRKTPFLTSLKTEKVHQKVHQWQEDDLAAAAQNAIVEGADAGTAAMTSTTMRSNNTQILEKVVKVTGSDEATVMYGRAKASAYQMGKKSAEIKKDLELSLVGVDQAAVAGDDTTARKFASVTKMIDSTHVIDADDAGGSTAPLDETHVLAAQRVLYADGGEASILMVKPSDSELIAGFARAGSRTQQTQAKDTTLVNSVDFYKSSYDTVRVVMNRNQLTSFAFMYDPSYWRLLVFRNWFRETLAKTGDALKMHIIGEFSLKHTNFKASAAIKNLS